MEFIKDYMDIPKYRHALNEMTKQIFGFSFESWYVAGFYEGEYIPYSYVENGKIIANASANIMKMVQNGREKLYIQIGTVMTDPNWRNKGLARELIDRILHEYKSCVDGFFLYANLNAVGLYEKLGFLPLEQWRYSKQRTEKTIVSDCFVPVGEAYLPKYRSALRNAMLNSRLDQINRSSLQLFYTGKMEDVYYHPGMDCFAVMEAVDATLHLKSVISREKTALGEVLKRIPIQYDTVILGFTPDIEEEKDYIAQPYNGGDDYRLYYLGTDLEEIAKFKLYFPILSHA